jgi:hypothetical protein
MFAMAEKKQSPQASEKQKYNILTGSLLVDCSFSRELVYGACGCLIS